METLTIVNIKPQGGWIKMVDYLVTKYNWDREQQPLEIKLNCRLKTLIQLMKEFNCMVNMCNNVAPIEIYHSGELIFKTPLIIREGVISARIVRDVETLEDKNHIDIFESQQPYYLKIN